MYDRRGFSLIEVVVSISIVALMIGVGVPAFRQYGRLASFRQAADDIQLAILQAHNLSLAPEADKSAAENYYGVHLYPDGKYEVVRRCFDAGVSPLCASTTEVVVSRYQLDQSILVETTPAIGYLVGTGGKPVVPTIPDNEIHLRSTQITDDELATIVLIVNPITGQVVIEE